MKGMRERKKESMKEKTKGRQKESKKATTNIKKERGRASK